MATPYPHLAFDTLAYAQALIARGFEQKQAEALAIVTRDFVISGQATNEFVEATIQREITALENRMMKANAKLIAFAVGIILAGIPLIQAFLQRLG